MGFESRVVSFLNKLCSALGNIKTGFIKPSKYYRSLCPRRLKKGEGRKKYLFSKTTQKYRKEEYAPCDRITYGRPLSKQVESKKLIPISFNNTKIYIFMYRNTITTVDKYECKCMEGCMARHTY